MEGRDGGWATGTMHVQSIRRTLSGKERAWGMGGAMHVLITKSAPSGRERGYVSQKERVKTTFKTPLQVHPASGIFIVFPAGSGMERGWDTLHDDYVRVLYSSSSI